MPRGIKPLTLEEFTAHFWERVDSSAGPEACWPWTGGHMSSGYGIVNARAILPKPTPTHRVAFWLTHGRWPPEDTRHTCDNYGCNNPKHLLDGTHFQNMHDAIERGRFRIGGRTSGTWSKGQGWHALRTPGEPTETCPVCSRLYEKLRRDQSSCGRSTCRQTLYMRRKQANAAD